MFSAVGNHTNVIGKTLDGNDLTHKDLEKFDAILEMLLAAGYFRVRITELSPFDKVVGGLVWCITNSLMELDVDILFVENSTIGQRIKLSEQIVAALNKMECKYPLEPHQIQGQDFPKIYPVIQWLVKIVLAVRQASTARMFSEAMFDKSYSSQGGHPTDIAFKTSQKEALPFVNILKENYKPKRRFRRTEKLSFASSAAHVQYVLLEYGDHGGTAGAGTSAAGEGDDASVAALQALAAASGTAGVNVDGEDGEEEEEACNCCQIVTLHTHATYSHLHATPLDQQGCMFAPDDRTRI